MVATIEELSLAERVKGYRRMSVMEYQGKEIVKLDFSNLMGDELLDIMYEQQKFYQSLPEEYLGSIRFLCDIRGALLVGSALLEFKKGAKVSKPFARKIAGVIHMSGAKEVILKSVAMFAKAAPKFYKTEQEALFYLSI